MKKAMVLVDGDHHPPAVRETIDELRGEGCDIVGAAFCGGTEKADSDDLDEAYGVPVATGDDAVAAVRSALERFEPEVVIDLADEPTLMPDVRFRVASFVLRAGAIYKGADFELRPPIFERVLTKPSIQIFATGKRTGKTTVSSELARVAVDAGRRPVIVAVGRGGPKPPRVIESSATLDAEALVKMADEGLHAASDYVEDAVTAGVTTIGCRRVGGGLAGSSVRSNLADAARIAEERDEDLVILEGSGAAFPGVAVNAGLICIPAGGGPELVRGYLNPMRLLLADLAVVTMADEGSAAAEVEAAIRETAPGLDVVSVVSRPEPLSPVSGRKVFVCCTAPPEAGAMFKRHLESEYGCTVVGMTHRLAHRSKLVAELREAPDHEVLVTEIKGAGIDVAARSALAEGREVVLMNNRPQGDGMEDAFRALLDRASDPDR